MQLFFELIRVAIGNQESLSHTPNADEWGELYAMAKKQSLVGICFAGVQKLLINHSSSIVNLSESIRLQWMGIVAKIQQRNEVVNLQCVEVQKMLSESGFRSAILKGQGVGQLYAEHLRGLRQSGDIDVWLDGGMAKALAWCREKYGKVEFDYINAHVPCYKDTEVELHWRAQAMTNLFANRRLQKWLEREEVKTMMVGGKATLAGGVEIVVPTAEFNAFYILLHAYNHVRGEGLGLRQLMDYYFVLRTQISDEQLIISDDLLRLLKEFGMMRFARGVMWIMKHVFGNVNPNANPNIFRGIEPDEREGRFLLNEVMEGGNFGHHDKRIKKMSRDGRWQSVWAQLQHAVRMVRFAPMNMFWQPVWVAYHYIWKRTTAKKWL